MKYIYSFCCGVIVVTTAETGGIAITPRPSSENSKPKAGYPMTPFFGVDPVLYSDEVCMPVVLCCVCVHVV